jgi:hypothetical protein
MGFGIVVLIQDMFAEVGNNGTTHGAGFGGFGSKASCGSSPIAHSVTWAGSGTIA